MRINLRDLQRVPRTVIFLSLGFISLVLSKEANAQQCDEVEIVNGKTSSDSFNAVDFTDVNTGITVGTGGRILTTSDGGTNWIVRNSGTRETLLDLQMVSPQLAFTVGDKGTVLKTIDGGANWIKLPAFTANWLRAVKFTHPDTGLVAGANGTIFRTTNGGLTWTSVSAGVPANAQLVDMAFPSSRIGYLVSSAGLLLKTTNGGLSWSSIGPAVTYNYTSIAALSTTHIVMGRSDTNLLTNSTNGGSTLGTEYLNIVGARVYNMSLLNQNLGFAVGNNARIYRRANGSWSLVNNNLGAFNDIKFLTPGVGYAVGNGIIYKTTTGGASWIHQNPAPGVAYRSIHFLDQNFGVMGGYSGKFHKTTDGGQTFTTTTLSTPDFVEAVHFTSPTNGFAAAFKMLFRTTNGGASWTTTALTNPLDQVQGNFEFTSPTTGYLAVSNSFQGGLMKTVNGGASWALLPARFGIAQEVRFISPDTGFVASNSSTTGQIYKTTDAGTTWTQVHNETNFPISGIAFANSNTGVAIAGIYMNASKAWRTTNAGLSWQPIIFPADQSNFIFREIVKLRKNELLISGENGLMLKSIDAGATWVKLDQITGMSLNTLSRVNDSVTFVVSNQVPLLARIAPRTVLPTPVITGNGLILSSSGSFQNQWFLNGNPIAGATGQSWWALQNGTYTVQQVNGTCLSAMSAPVVVTLSTGLPEEKTDPDLTIYPNPAKEFLFVAFKTGAAYQEITVTNLQGQTIRNIAVNQQGPLKIDLKNLPAGVYIISARAASHVRHQKIILL